MALKPYTLFLRYLNSTYNQCYRSYIKPEGEHRGT